MRVVCDGPVPGYLRHKQRYGFQAKTAPLFLFPPAVVVP
jgi:hypothetical protein